jgi:hypothetical protein
LKRHLDEGVRADPALLHQTLAVVVVDVDSEVDVTQQIFGGGFGRLDLLEGSGRHVPLQTGWCRGLEFGNAKAVAALVIPLKRERN